MQDVAIELDDRTGALADMGEALGRAGISIEGGGAWVVSAGRSRGNRGVAHFLFAEGGAAQAALEAAGIRVLAVRDVLVQRLRQDEPGQLGKITRLMADGGVNIEALYSDHANQLILVVDDIVKGRQVATSWRYEPAPCRLAAIRVEL